MERWIEDWLEYLQKRLLNDTVAHSGNSEFSCAAPVFCYFNSLDGERAITLVPQFTNQHGDFIGQTFRERLHSLAVYSRFAVVGFHLLECTLKTLGREQAII